MTTATAASFQAQTWSFREQLAKSQSNEIEDRLDRYYERRYPGCEVERVEDLAVQRSGIDVQLTLPGITLGAQWH